MEQKNSTRVLSHPPSPYGAHRDAKSNFPWAPHSIVTPAEKSNPSLMGKWKRNFEEGAGGSALRTLAKNNTR